MLIINFPIYSLKKQIQHVSEFKFPSQFTKSFPKIYQNYLIDRGFDFEQVKKDFNLYCSSFWGRYKFRVILPIIMDGRIISFVGRDITNKQYLKYLNCKETESVLPRKDWLFNYDSITGDRIIIVEGPMDAMKVKDNCVALLTTNFTKSQILQLKKKGVKKIFIGFDNDKAGKEKSELISRYITWTDEVFQIQLPSYAKDIGELTNDDINYLKREIL